MAIELIVSSSALAPATLFAPTPKAARRVMEFFTAQINNDHTRKAYDRRVEEISLDESRADCNKRVDIAFLSTRYRELLTSTE